MSNEKEEVNDPIDPVIDGEEEAAEETKAAVKTKPGKAKANPKQKYTPPSKEACLKPGRYELPSGAIVENA